MQPSYQRYELGPAPPVDGIASAHGARVELATMPAMGAAESSPEASRADDPRRRLVYDGLLERATAGSADGWHRRLRPGAVPGRPVHEFLDGVQVRSADGIHTPAYAPGNAFAGNATEPVAHAFYDWLSPRLWPLIVATDRA